MIKVKNIVYNKKPLQQVVYQETTIYGLRKIEEAAVLEHLNFFKKVINELLAVSVKIDEEDRTLILLSSFSELYGYIVTTILYGKITLILKEVMSTILSNEIKKDYIKLIRSDRVWWL